MFFVSNTFKSLFYLYAAPVPGLLKKHMDNIDNNLFNTLNATSCSRDGKWTNY